MEGGYEAQEVSELRAELRRRGLVSSGEHAELVQRLQDHNRLTARRSASRPAEESERCLAARRLLDEACAELGQEAEVLLSEAFAADSGQLMPGAPLSPDDDSDLLGVLVPEGGEEFDEVLPIAGSDEYFLAAEEELDGMFEEEAVPEAEADTEAETEAEQAAADAEADTEPESEVEEAAAAAADAETAGAAGEQEVMAAVMERAASSSSAPPQAAVAGAGADASGEGGEHVAPNPLAIAWLRSCAMMGAMEAQAAPAAAAGADAGGAVVGPAMAGGMVAAWLRACGAAREASAEVPSAAPGGEDAAAASASPPAARLEALEAGIAALEARAASAPEADAATAGPPVLAAPVEPASAVPTAPPRPAPAAVTRAAKKEPAAASLTPRLQCLRDLARRSCAELGMPYASFIDKLRGRAKAYDLSGKIASFRVRDRVVLPPFKAVRLAKPKRAAVGAKAASHSPPAVVILDGDTQHEAKASKEEVDKEDSGVAPVPPGADAGAGGASEDAADPYASRTAPLVLLRTYLSQDRWVGMRQGLLVFEDDGVQYHGATLAPVWEQKSGGSLLSLASLWLLGSLRERYETHLKQSLLQRHRAVRVATNLVPSLLDFLLGRQSSCELLVAEDRLYAVPVPSPLRLPRPNTAAPGARPPLAPTDLRSLPGESPLEKRELLEKRAAEGLERLRRQVAERSQGRPEAEGLQLVEGLQAVSKVQMSLRRLEMEEKALTKLREELQARLHAADRRLLKASKRREQLHEEYRSQLSALHAAAKRRRLASDAAAPAAESAGGRRDRRDRRDGAAGGDRPAQKAPATEELIHQLLTALEAGAVKAPRQGEPLPTLE